MNFQILKKLMKNQNEKIILIKLSILNILNKILIVSIMIENSLVMQILETNKNSIKLQKFWNCAEKQNSKWILENDFLKYNKCVMMFKKENLWIYFLNKIHWQIATAHSEIKKIVKLLISWYYWSDMTKNIEWYMINCHICWWVKHLQNSSLELLQSFFILQKSWQHIAMNFLFLLKNKHKYNATFIIMNKLSKCFYSLSCIKKITVKNMIRLYVVYIYWIYKSLNIIVSDHDL